MKLAYIAFVFLVLPELGAADIPNDTKESGRKWLEDRAAEDGVVKTPSGLLYKVITEGSGTARPGPTDSCSIHYHGTLPNGTVFDSSYDRGGPIRFAVNQVVKGWMEALLMMHEGDKWELYIPYELAYSVGGAPPHIPGFSPLKYETELISINSPNAMRDKHERAALRRSLGVREEEDPRFTQLKKERKDKKDEEEKKNKKARNEKKAKKSKTRTKTDRPVTEDLATSDHDLPVDVTADLVTDPVLEAKDTKGPPEEGGEL
jgi:FKBP-type peptidyl-prolyl cis-trans isomerase